MKLARFFPLLLAAAPLAHGSDEWLDLLDEKLTLAPAEDVRFHLSGTVELEALHHNLPPPGLIDTNRHFLFNPRLTLFLDAQLGPMVYAFAQARVDRGFDPAQGTAQMRLDEWAVRVTPWEDGRFNVQLGKFAMVFGTWTERHLAWDNPFINAPLVYENITSIYDTEALGTAAEFVAGPPPDERYEYNPVIWGPSYSTGASVAGHFRGFEYAVEIKNASISSRPESWDLNEIDFSHPTVNARIGWRPNEMWRFGFSASEGAYFRPEAQPTLPSGRGIGDYKQLTLGQDVSFAWHHWQVWAEVFEARFEVPRVGRADTVGYYVEAKYKIAPQLFAALRWNQQLFNSVDNREGGSEPWSRDQWRVDAAIGFRFTAHTQLKLQYSLQHETDGPTDFGHSLGAQLMLRF